MEAEHTESIIFVTGHQYQGQFALFINKIYKTGTKKVQGRSFNTISGVFFPKYVRPGHFRDPWLPVGICPLVAILDCPRQIQYVCQQDNRYVATFEAGITNINAIFLGFGDEEHTRSIVFVF